MRKETSQLMAILTPQLSPQEFHSPDLNVLKALLHSTNPWYSLGTRQRHVSPMTTPVVLCTTSTNLIKAFNHQKDYVFEQKPGNLKSVSGRPLRCRSSEVCRLELKCSDHAACQMLFQVAECFIAAHATRD